MTQPIGKSESNNETRRAAYEVDSVEGGCRNLRDLINVICEIRFCGPLSEDDTRLDSLLWIARDLAEGLEERRQIEAGEEAAAKSKKALMGRVAA